jgi:hypothetical protein
MRIRLDPLKVVAKAYNFRILTTYARQNQLMRKSRSTYHPAAGSTISAVDCLATVTGQGHASANVALVTVGGHQNFAH